MLGRRTFIQSGLALPIMSLAAGIPARARAERAGHGAVLPLERFVFDARFAEASDVAAQIAALGVAQSPTAGDLTELWYNELDRKWKQSPQALAGVTTEEGLFVLETLALDHRMRVVYRGTHAVADRGRIVHELQGPAAMLDGLATRGEEANWAETIGLALTRCPLGEPAAARVEFTTRVNGISLRDVPLYSWIIAPRSAVALTLAS